MAGANKPIVLVGMPGSGKSTTAQALATALGRRAVDLDQALAERSGRSTAELLRREGEQAFRAQEAELLQTLLEQPGTVLAVGGGAPCFHDAMTLMRAAAEVVWLDAPVEVLLQRTLQDGDRPLLGDTRAEQQAALQRLAAQRSATYARAHRRVDASRPIREVVAQIQGPQTGRLTQAVDFAGQHHDVVLDPGPPADAADAVAVHAQTGRVALLVDARVLMYAEPLQIMLAARGLDVQLLVLPGGEKSKDIRVLTRIWTWLAQFGFGRDDLLVALGGGATTDVAGLAAATWQRGMPWIAMPTTVLAMADASIGAKTAIDLPAGKNLVGALHAPVLVWLALGALPTLPSREFRSGLAEIAKIFAVFDVDAWSALVADGPALKRRQIEALRPHLVRAIAWKARVVAADPRERLGSGPLDRRLLNFGHTLGHAFESQSGFSLRHGEAVALGMCIAADLSQAMGLAADGTSATIVAGLQVLGLPTDYESLVTDAALERLAADKKKRGDTLAFIALRQLGAACVAPVRAPELVALARVLATAPAGTTPRVHLAEALSSQVARTSGRES